MRLIELVRHHATGARGKRLAARLTRMTERLLPIGDQTVGCLVWKGSVNNDGYPKGNFWFVDRSYQVYIHHLTWCLRNGRDIKPGLERDHTCDTRNCVEPSHVEEVTHKENCRRRLYRVPFTYADAVIQLRQQQHT